MSNEKTRQLEIRLEPIEKGPPGIYSNFMMANHTKWDFTLHFGHFILPTTITEETKYLEAKAVARITVPITLIKGIVKALNENIATFEKTHGVIASTTED
ncbi:MAG: DUF3467 domain-containing protein [Candidatus Brocadiaceae bacterium]|nr:DUF3467 domain-containing protein [Candidatus Brocadiaceae bacterium]